MVRVSLLLLQACSVVMDVVLFQCLLLAIAELTTEEEALETVEVCACDCHMTCSEHVTVT